MTYAESYSGLDNKVLEVIKKVIPVSFFENLQDKGASIEYPRDKELELKVKFDISEEGGSVSIKISWDNELEELEEDDEEEKD